MSTNFGSGRLYGTRNDVAGGTPMEFGVLQGVKLDFEFTVKPLTGSNQWPVFIARGEAKLTATAETAIMSGSVIGQLFFGLSPVAGQLALQAAENHSVPASSPYTVTPTPPNSGTFVADEGVIYASGANAGQPLTPVASNPAAGEYTVSAGVYTFAAADEGAAVNISYTYSVSATGQKIQITQQLLGTTPTFSSVYRNRDPKTGLFNTLVLNKVTSSKLSMQSKTSDWEIPSFDMQVMDDGTGNIGTWSFGDTD